MGQGLTRFQADEDIWAVTADDEYREWSNTLMLLNYALLVPMFIFTDRF
jgi:hypothetical protein